VVFALDDERRKIRARAAGAGACVMRDIGADAPKVEHVPTVVLEGGDVCRALMSVASVVNEIPNYNPL
jgi:hypothetical protein